MESSYREDVKAVIDDMLDQPEIKSGKSWGYPSYRANNRIFLFVGGDGIALKLPTERIQALIANHDGATPFSPVDGTTWKQWVSLDHLDPDDYRQYHDLFEESIAFVSSGGNHITLYLSM